MRDHYEGTTTTAAPRAQHAKKANILNKPIAKAQAASSTPAVQQQQPVQVGYSRNP